MSEMDELYPITDRLRCNYMGRDFSGKMEVELPTTIMREAADFIEARWEQIADLTKELEKHKSTNLKARDYLANGCHAVQAITILKEVDK